MFVSQLAKQATMTENEEKYFDNLFRSAWKWSCHTFNVCYTIIGFCVFWIWILSGEYNWFLMLPAVIIVHIALIVFMIPVLCMILKKIFSFFSVLNTQIEKAYKSSKE
jgi:hypothetical protein